MRSPLPLAIATSLLAPVFAGGQSLVEYARQEKARREAVQQAHGGEAKSYSLQNAGSAPLPANAPNRAPTAPRASAEDTSAGRELRGKVASARAQVDLANRRLEYLERAQLKPGEVLLDLRGRTARTNEEVQAKARVEKERLETARRTLADAEEQARRATVARDGKEARP